MASLDTNDAKPKSGRHPSKRNTRVDLTPMVDLGFLLITFFVFTTTMAQPKAMEIMSPKDSKTDSTKIQESVVITFLPDSNQQLHYYEGSAGPNAKVHHIPFNAESIRNILQAKKASMPKLHFKSTDVVLIIQPLSGSDFQQLVDLLDEVIISDIRHYFISDEDALARQLALKQ